MQNKGNFLQKLKWGRVGKGGNHSHQTSKYIWFQLWFFLGHCIGCINTVGSTSWCTQGQFAPEAGAELEKRGKHSHQTFLLIYGFNCDSYFSQTLKNFLKVKWSKLWKKSTNFKESTDGSNIWMSTICMCFDVRKIGLLTAHCQFECTNILYTYHMWTICMCFDEEDWFANCSNCSLPI